MGEAGRRSSSWGPCVCMVYKVSDPSIVLPMLDAHDPSRCYSWLVEEEVGGREVKEKRFPFVLNKVGT